MRYLETRAAPDRLAVAACALLCGCVLLSGLAAVTASFLPYGFFLARAKAATATGQLSLFTFAFYRALQLRLRIIGTVNLGAGVLAVVCRQRIWQFVADVFRDAAAFLRDIKLALRSVPSLDSLTLLCLVIVAAVVRIPFLSQPMRDDEAYAFLVYSSRPFYVTLSLYNAPNNHLLHSLLVRIVYLVFGDHLWALRLPVLLAGLCLAPATYFAARSLYRSGGALLAAALVASSSILTEFSTNARGYMILTLVFVCLIPLAAYLLRNQNCTAWAAFAILGALGFYTVPTMLYPFGGLCLCLFLSTTFETQGRGAGSLVTKLLVACGLAGFLTFELYAPVLAVSGPAALFANKWVRPRPIHVFLTGMPPSLISTWKQWNRDLPLWLVWVLLGGFLISLAWTRRESRFRVPLTLALVLWIGPLLFFQRVIPYERVWLFALPLYLTAASAGLAAVFSPWLQGVRLRQAIAILAMAIAIFAGWRVRRNQSVFATNNGRGLQDLAYYLKGRLGPGDSVVAGFSSDAQMLYYLREAGEPQSYVNAPHPTRMLVVVNGVSGETVARVLDMLQLNNYQNRPARLLVRCDTASLYELGPAGVDSTASP